ncbi:hypothetical protein [uncultured Tateyamaria sp.]|uniref:hypothetical protein n=1 Tax=uncultured Tateyamaria sp. TaxID=455651 RepID=UPI0026146257|nr:hypothetical protein [uncultured Tateyamaria sp.]
MTLLECAEQTRAVPFALFVAGAFVLGLWIKSRYRLTLVQTIRVFAGRTQSGVVLPAKAILAAVLGVIAFGLIWGALVLACKG